MGVTSVPPPNRVQTQSPHAYRGHFHEGEYVALPSRPFPISSTSGTPAGTPAADALLRMALPDAAALGVATPTAAAAAAADTTAEAAAGAAASLLPPLVHKWTHSHSILCVIAAPSKNLLICGAQDSKILMYDMNDYSLKHEVVCGSKDHSSLVLCLALSSDENHLFSAGSDSLVKVWDLAADEVRCSHIIYLVVDIGDIFSVSWLASLQTLFIGAQNAAILWCPLELGRVAAPESAPADADAGVDRLPHLRYDKFFDSRGPGGLVNCVQTKHQLHRATESAHAAPKARLVEIDAEAIIRFAHHGYVYCMEVFDCAASDDFLHNYRQYSSVLVSCGGDGVVNLWGVDAAPAAPHVRIARIAALDSEDLVLSFTVHDSYIYAGLLDSTIMVWDLCTLQLIRSFRYTDGGAGEAERVAAPALRGHHEILGLGIHNHCIYKASNRGGLTQLTLSGAARLAVFEEVHLEPLLDHHGSVLALGIFRLQGATFLLSGCNRGLCLYDVSDSGSDTKEQLAPMFSTKLDNQLLLEALKSYILYKTILRYPALYVDDLRHCAQFITKLLISLGAQHAKLLPVACGNPVVHAAFSHNAGHATAKRLLWYAHYDVVDAEGERDDWATDPFRLTARDGNLYARGVSDNKGPTLAAIYAVAELYAKHELLCDVVFIIEGEEECGSIGFQSTINAHRDAIGHIDWVMLLNLYWLDDETPCLNYGLRGVINALVTVRSAKPDRHSGVDGGVLREPTMDLIQVLATLADSVTLQIAIPHFYDDVLPITPREMEIYGKIERAALARRVNDQDIKTLLAKWRNPSLTVHKVEVSGPNNTTVIPQTALALILIRVVPNQNLAEIKRQLTAHLEHHFGRLGSDNALAIDIFHEAEPWLGDPTNAVYTILYRKLIENWGPQTPKPLFIREGGSIPSIRFLEKCFNAPAAQIPCGQGSDNAHLKDEKLRVLNLFKLRSVLYDTFKELGHI